MKTPSLFDAKLLPWQMELPKNILEAINQYHRSILAEALFEHLKNTQNEKEN